MISHRFTLPGLALTALALAAAPAVAQGTQVGPNAVTQSSYNVIVYTSSLTPGSLYTLDFQFFDGTYSGGTGTADGNNIVNLSAINFGGNTPGTTTLAGGSSSPMNGTYRLTDSNATNPAAEFTQDFTESSNGSPITFTISLPTSAADAGQSADELAFSVLTARGAEALPTSDPAGSNGVLLTFDYPTTRDPRFTYTNYSPQYVQFAAAPEPSQTAALGLGVLGLAGLALVARRRRSA